MSKKRAETREGMVVTNIALDKTLHRRLAIAALDEGSAITHVVREAVREWLDRRDAKLKSRRKR